MTEVVVFGDSNTATLVGVDDPNVDQPKTRVAFRCLAVSGRAFELPFHEGAGPSLRLRVPDEFKHIRIPDGFDLTNLAGDRVFVFSFGVFPVRLVSSATWRHHAPWRLADGLAPISDGLLREMIWQDAAAPLRFFSDIGDVRAVAVQAPPPRADHPIIHDLGVRPEIVAAVDSAYRQVMTEKIERLGIEVVAPPASTWHAGFLRDDLKSERAGDTHHANRAYGRLMIGEIDRVLRRRFGVEILADSTAATPATEIGPPDAGPS